MRTAPGMARIPAAWGRAALQVDHQDAGVDFMRNGKAIPVDGQTNQDLLAIGTVIAEYPRLALGLARARPSKKVEVTS